MYRSQVPDIPLDVNFLKFMFSLVFRIRRFRHKRRRFRIRNTAISYCLLTGDRGEQCADNCQSGWLQPGQLHPQPAGVRQRPSLQYRWASTLPF